MTGEQTPYQHLLAAAAAANERIETCHQHVACPTCGAAIGERCTSVAHGRYAGRRLKHPHPARWAQVQPAR